MQLQRAFRFDLPYLVGNHVTEEEYKILCSTCDEVLSEANFSIDLLAIPWLHILNEHPVNLAKYDAVFGPGSGDIFVKHKSYLRTVLDLANRRKTENGWVASRDISNKIDIIFVSHLINVNHIGGDKDFYFGSTPEDLSKHGHSSVVVLNDHTGHHSHDLQGKWLETHSPRVLFNGVLSTSEEIAIRRRLNYQSKVLKERSKRTKTRIKKRILELASQQALSSNAISTLRFYLQFSQLVALTRPKAIIVTYEGHAWERIAFAAARNIIKDVTCIGYQHTILFPRQHALKRSLGHNTDPDVILTVGENTRAVLSKVEALKRTRIEVVGTHRYERTQTKFTERFSKELRNSCLVIPDGTPSECVFLVKFAIEAARLAPNIGFLIRMHPVITFEDIARSNPELENLPVNMKISTNLISEDFYSSRWAIYRGSSAAIHSIGAGLRPLFVFKAIDELAIDPMHDLKLWKKSILQPCDLVKAIMRDLEADSSDLLREWELAMKYCGNYYSDFNLKTLVNILRGD